MKFKKIGRNLLLSALLVVAGGAVILTSCGHEAEVEQVSFDTSKIVGVWSNGRQASETVSSSWYAELNIGSDVTGTWRDDEFEGQKLVSELISDIRLTMIADDAAIMIEQYKDESGVTKMNKYNLKVVENVLYVWEDSEEFDKADCYYKGEKNYLAKAY